MLHWLWLVPALPFAGFLVLALAGSRLPRRVVSFVGVGSVAASAVVSILIAITNHFFLELPAGHLTLLVGPAIQTLWTWIPGSHLYAQFSLALDSLSLVMILVVSIVATLILLYSVRFMAEDPGYSRFFAWMDLFVASMLALVLAGDLLLLYLGWEGVGLCSFLLIGFWYREPANIRAARKAFIITRIGDVALLIGIVLLVNHFDTTDIYRITCYPGLPVGSGLALAAALLLLGGAVGKSAQLPLQTWLPDAMAGPTPVSALIHAATMVTAGVYLIARMHSIFELAPAAMTAVAVIGTVTMLLAGFAALVQRDIKRVLAYSTMSQVGLMFLALGVGAWPAAIFQFATHAFFKALLFMAAGVVILALKGEHDIFKMGGLRKSLPWTCFAFLAGAASLAALPFVTAGFYSKDLILLCAFWLEPAHPWFFCLGLLGAFLTALYSFRLFFLVFLGPERSPSSFKPGLLIGIPLALLAILSLAGGLLSRIIPNPFALITHSALAVKLSHSTISILELYSALASLAGVLFAWILFAGNSRLLAFISRLPLSAALSRVCFSGFGFDFVYNALFVAPFVWLARVNRGDFIDSFYAALAWLCRAGNELLSENQTGNIRWYAVGIAVGAIIIIAIVVLL